MVGLGEHPPRRVGLHGAVAGLIGGILIDAFLYFATILPNHGSLASMYSYIASTALGNGVLGGPSAVWLGVFIHFAVSIAWGMGLAYAVVNRPDTLSHPYIAGVVFGFVVLIIMQIVLALTQHFQKPTAQMFAGSFLAHTLFFGLPVALYLSSALQRTRVARNH
jgi:hypothetical protein